jgi:hypothetical protein
LFAPFFKPRRCHKPNGIFISQTGHLSAKRDIYQPNIYQPNIYQPNKIFISQLKYLSAKWEHLSAKLRGGWCPKPGASRPNHYIGIIIPASALILYHQCVYQTNPCNLQGSNPLPSCPAAWTAAYYPADSASTAILLRPFLSGLIPKQFLKGNVTRI